VATAAAEATRVEAPALAAAQAVAPLKAAHAVPAPVVKRDHAADFGAVAEPEVEQVTVRPALAASPAVMQTLRVEVSLVMTVAVFYQTEQHPEEAQSVVAVQIPAAAIDIIS
tara:strand:+ start:188 stop:523 length:336 start_codon:yes stop_codon:yes gene_type:complete